MKEDFNYKKQYKETKDMKRKISVLILVAMACQMAACSIQPTCRADGCNETEIYEEGYCKYHYYENVGENILKDIFN